MTLWRIWQELAVVYNSPAKAACKYQPHDYFENPASDDKNHPKNQQKLADQPKDANLLEQVRVGIIVAGFSGTFQTGLRPLIKGFRDFFGVLALPAPFFQLLDRKALAVPAIAKHNLKQLIFGKDSRFFDGKPIVVVFSLVDCNLVFTRQLH